MMPHEFTFDCGEFDSLFVQFRCDLRRPVFGNGLERVCEVHLVHELYTLRAQMTFPPVAERDPSNVVHWCGGQRIARDVLVVNNRLIKRNERVSVQRGETLVTVLTSEDVVGATGAESTTAAISSGLDNTASTVRAFLEKETERGSSSHSNPSVDARLSERAPRARGLRGRR